MCYFVYFFFNDTATTEIYTLSLHDALPIFLRPEGPFAAPAYRPPDAHRREVRARTRHPPRRARRPRGAGAEQVEPARPRSEEHTSELQSRQYLVCRLLLEKKKK